MYVQSSWVLISYLLWFYWKFAIAAFLRLSWWSSCSCFRRLWDAIKCYLVTSQWDNLSWDGVFKMRQTEEKKKTCICSDRRDKPQKIIKCDLPRGANQSHCEIIPLYLTHDRGFSPFFRSCAIRQESASVYLCWFSLMINSKDVFENIKLEYCLFSVKLFNFSSGDLRISNPLVDSSYKYSQKIFIYLYYKY